MPYKITVERPDGTTGTVIISDDDAHAWMIRHTTSVRQSEDFTGRVTDTVRANALLGDAFGRWNCDWWVEDHGDGSYSGVDTINGVEVRRRPASARDICQAVQKGDRMREVARVEG